MSVHPIDYRYGSPEMRAVFEEEKRLEQQLRVEAALADVLADLGKIPRDAAQQISAKANTRHVKLERVKQIEEETKHDVMALVKALTEQCEDAGKYVHLTATSYDIVDTAQALQIKEALEILLEKSKELLKNALAVAEKYKDLVMIGRTHGQHAIPITFGFKIANYADKIGENIMRLEQDKKYIQGKFSGAVGTYAAQQLYELGDELERKVMEKLGIRAADISTQVVARENLARIISDVIIFSCTLEQIAKEIRNLQRTEISEASEPFGSRQVGSSTMAQKRNPINTENICSNVRIIRSCILPALENIALEHERDLTNSASERSFLPTAFILADDVVSRTNSVLKDIVVFPENMRKNLELSKGTIMAEAIITDLVKRGMGRQDAHELLRENSMHAFSEGKDLKDLLLSDERVSKYLSAEELEKIMDYKNYIGLAVQKTEQIIKKWRNLAGNNMKVLRVHEGSAKNTLIYKEPSQKEGEGAFEFLDYFSIFDWGRFLDSPIRFKGIAMAAIAKKHFELLQKAGIKTHYLGMESPNRMNVAVVKIPEPYKTLAPGSRNCLLPIEIIFRIYTHPESSDLRKIKEGKKTFQELGYEYMPEPNKRLPHVKMSYSTKLEPEDRVLTREEARILSGLTHEEMDRLEELALKANDIITKNSEVAGMIHYDGKIEVAKDSNGEFMVVDVVGSLDEDRFMANVGNGKFVDVSKQFLRNWYIANGWKAKADAAKKKADIRTDWTSLCEPPPKLPEKISVLMTEMYLADAEARTGLKIGSKIGINVRPIKEVAKEMYELQEAHNSGRLKF